jgi:hypothetical protein
MYVTKGGEPVYDNWYSNFLYWDDLDGILPLTSGGEYEIRFQNEDGETDYDVTFSFEEAGGAFGAVQQVTTITESDYAGKAVHPNAAAVNATQYQVAYPITFGDADKDYSIMIKTTSGTLPGELILCKSEYYKEWGMISYSDLYAAKGNMRSYVAANPYNRLTNSESRGYLGGEPNQYCISGSENPWVRIVPGGTYYILIARDNLSYTGTFVVDVKVQQVNSYE